MIDPILLKKLNEAADRYKKMLRKANSGKKSFNVVVIGQYNNGKSTLCNALMNNWENNLFRVADIRETVKAQQETDPVRGITYIDTPGYDSANDEDDRKAREEWIKANLIIFVHSVRKGELDEKECAMLDNLRATVPDLEKRLYVACSKKSEENGAAVRASADMVHKQITERLGRNAGFGIIDSNDYLDGGECGDLELMDDSGIPDIFTWIDANRHVPSAADRMLKNEEKLFQDILDKVRKNLEQQYSTQKESVSNYNKKLNLVWEKGKPPIQTAWNNCARYRG